MSPSEEPQIAALAGRAFAFYPAIRGFEHNEWTLDKQTWAEVLVKNASSGESIWVPRSHIGEIASSESPIVIVGLIRELQYKAGAVVPYRAPVVAMPSPLGSDHRQQGGEPEPAVPKRSSTAADVETFSFVAKAVLVALALVVLLVMSQVSDGENPIASLFRSDTSTADQMYLGLTNADSYQATIERVGRPEREQWLSAEEADLQIRLLRYPQRRYDVVLMGGTRADARYFGTLHDPSRRILDAAQLSRGGDTASLLRNLPAFPE